MRNKQKIPAHRLKSTILKHLLIEEQKMIGLQFYPDKVIQALVKELSGVKWSNTFQMAFVPNNKNNLKVIFKKFRGDAWINTKYFFSNKLINESTDFSIEKYRNREPE